MARSTWADKQTFWEDWVIAWFHPAFRDMDPLQAYRAVNRLRHGNRFMTPDYTEDGDSGPDLLTADPDRDTVTVKNRYHGSTYDAVVTDDGTVREHDGPSAAAFSATAYKLLDDGGEDNE